jgi:hypothetical protein
MLRRAFHIMHVAMSLLFVGSASRYKSRADLTLQIESLSRNRTIVRVSTTVVGTERTMAAAHDTILAVPATLVISDSIGRIRVLVLSGFLPVRVTLTNRINSADSLISEGRDITLARRGGGRFVRIWTAQPLVP